MTSIAKVTSLYQIFYSISQLKEVAVLIVRNATMVVKFYK